MGYVALNCPNCQGEIQLDDSRESGFCLYCGTKIVLQEALQKTRIDRSKEISNFLLIAQNAIEQGSYKMAETYAMKAIELDATSAEAWKDRAIAQAWQSSIEEPNYEEIIFSIRQAVSFSGISQIESISTELLRHISDSSVAMGTLNRNMQMRLTGTQRVFDTASHQDRIILLFSNWIVCLLMLPKANYAEQRRAVQLCKQAEHPGNFFNCFYNSIIDQCARVGFGMPFSNKMMEVLSTIPEYSEKEDLIRQYDENLSSELERLNSQRLKLSDQIDNEIYIGKKKKAEKLLLLEERDALDEEIRQFDVRRSEYIESL